MNMPTIQKRRGRPPKEGRSREETQQALLRAGTEAMTSHGFTASGLDQILKSVGVPKGSFYYYFSSKEAWGMAVLEWYDAFFRRMLEKHLNNTARPPLSRLADFVDQACAGMAKYQFTRGCLVGNLGQEGPLLSADFCARLEAVLQGWQALVEQTLQAARDDGTLAPGADCAQLAAFFWIGWEGAVLRARLTRSEDPMRLFLAGFLAGLPRI